MKIETEAEYGAALEYKNKLMPKWEKLDAKLDVICLAIQRYESEHYPIPVAKPSLWTRIKFRLGQRFGRLNWMLG